MCQEKKGLTKFQKVFLFFFIISAISLRLWSFHWPTAVVKLKGQELKVLVANSSKRRYKGLGGRDNLGEYDGMLFIFPVFKKYMFVMRDMRFPIDIVWFKRDKVVDIAPNAQIEPNKSETELTKYIPRTEANVVLELPAGWSKKHGLRIGDVLSVVERGS